MLGEMPRRALELRKSKEKSKMVFFFLCFIATPIKMIN